MARIEKTVFISYRRRDISWALAVYQDLTHNRYDVFFDYTSIPSGDFEQIIISNIKARAHFVLILTPATLDRCDEPGDWLRREIEKAMDEKRNIIPLFFDGFNFGAKNVSEKLTGKLKSLSRYNGMNVHHDYFQEGMERLRNQFLNVPLDTVLHPISEEVREVVREEQHAADQALKAVPAPRPKPATKTPKQPSIGQVPNLIESVGPKKQRKSKPVKEKKSVVETPEISQVVSRQPVKPVVLPDKLILSNGMEFMRVPAGKFIMGNTNGGDNEKPQHTVDIPFDYWMGRYPVTNEQFNSFVTAKKIKHPVSDWEKKKDHPVVNVSWDTVMEYSQWLNNLIKAELPSGLVLRLPTEAEWEKAARGTDGREYPWGNTTGKNKCNSKGGKKRGTTPVDMYSPQGDSPYGCADMAGNVLEWTHSEHKPYPYYAKDGRENKPKSGPYVLRSSSFLNYVGHMHCADRFSSYSSSWADIFGFRCVVAPSLA